MFLPPLLWLCALLLLHEAGATSVSQLISEIPTCALSCFHKHQPKRCPVNSSNYYRCLCGDEVQLAAQLTPCVLANCPNSELTRIEGLTLDICNAYKSSLSTGAKAGIAIGVLVGVFAVVIGGVACFRRRRRLAKNAADDPQGRKFAELPGESSMQEVSGENSTLEVSGESSVQQLSAETPAQQLASVPIYELPTNNYDPPSEKG